MVRWLNLLAFIALAAVAHACGGDPAVSSDVAADTSPPGDTQVVADTAQGGAPCCPFGNCPSGLSCTQGACLPAAGAGQCWLDGQCLPGQVCQGANACGCGDATCEPALGTCGYPAGCCNGDGDCAQGELCVAGQCRSAEVEGCWRDDQCAAGQACEGQSACACGDSACTATPGFCGLPGVCCIADAECGAGGVCRGGSCVAARAAPGCFDDAACGTGEACAGASLCACGASDCAVPTTAGRCLAEDDRCCVSASDCGAGELCVEGRGCLAAPDADHCWVDDHCGVGRVCDGATLCDCGEADCTPSQGQCRTVTTPCQGDGDCGVALRCAVPDTAICPGEEAPTTGVCVPRVDAGCWNQADCGPYIRCSGEEVCTDPAGCFAPNAPGVCRDKVRIKDCCSSHDECGDGLECRNQNATKTCPPDNSAVCLPQPILGESCWVNADCPQGDVCNRVIICGCNGKCRWYNQGQCEKPLYCQSDLDCGSDATCARDSECIASPCTTQATCDPGGRCQDKVDGACWTHDECGAGNYCEGLRVCPINSECPSPDMPGTCAPRADLGGCCTSYRGCEGGLRCVSVGARTGCLLDITSVCVPAVTLGLDCYADDDCGAGQHCEGQFMCPCGVDTCTGPPVAGTCVGDQP